MGEFEVAADLKQLLLTIWCFCFDDRLSGSVGYSRWRDLDQDVVAAGLEIEVYTDRTCVDVVPARNVHTTSQVFCGVFRVVDAEVEAVRVATLETLEIADVWLGENDDDRTWASHSDMKASIQVGDRTCSHVYGGPLLGQRPGFVK